MARVIARRLQHLAQGAHRLNEKTNGWLGIFLGAAKETLKPSSAIKAAAIAYFALLSLFPLTLLSIGITSFALGALIDQQQIIGRLEFVAPALGLLIGQNIDEIIRSRESVTGIALIGLIWSASTLFYMLAITLNEIWSSKKLRPVWKRRGLAIIFVLTFIGPALLIVSFTGSLVANVRSMLPLPIQPIGAVINFISAILLDISFFMVLYMLLPHGTANWRDILPGAVGAGLLWELAKKGFLVFVATYITITNLIYGSVATIFAFLAWAYVSGLIFVFGAYLSVYFWQRRVQRQEAAVAEAAVAQADAAPVDANEQRVE